MTIRQKKKKVDAENRGLVCNYTNSGCNSTDCTKECIFNDSKKHAFCINKYKFNKCNADSVV